MEITDEASWGPLTRVSTTDGRTGRYAAGTTPRFTGRLYRRERSEMCRLASFPYGVVGNPAVTASRCIVGTLGGQVVAFDRADHSVWERSLSAAVPSGPTVVDETVVVCDFRGGVVAYDATDGTRLWRRELPGLLDTAPVTADGTIYVGGTRRLAAIDLDGTHRWQVECETLRPPAVCDGVVVVAGTDDRIRAYDPADGTRRWRRQLRATGLVAADGGVVAATRDGTVRRLTTDGTDEWCRSITEPTVALASRPDGGVVVCGRTACRLIDSDGDDVSLGRIPSPVARWTVLDGEIVGTATDRVVVCQPEGW